MPMLTQAAIVSALTFAVGAAFPIIVALLAPTSQITFTVVMATLVAFTALDALGASAGGAVLLKDAPLE
jgi:hypothetical protein